MVSRDDDPIVMVVDDERDFLVLAKALLKNSGFRVEARTRAPSWRDLLVMDPAVILMDVVLEGENGAEVCRAIKLHPRLARLPVILVSGHGEDRLQKEVSYCGADGFLTKPISKALVLQLADHYVKRYRRTGGLYGARPHAAEDKDGDAPPKPSARDVPVVRDGRGSAAQRAQAEEQLRARATGPPRSEHEGEEPEA